MRNIHSGTVLQVLHADVQHCTGAPGGLNPLSQVPRLQNPIWGFPEVRDSFLGSP